MGFSTENNGIYGGRGGEKLKNGFVEVFNENQTGKKKSQLTDILISLEKIPDPEHFWYKPVLSAYITVEIISAPNQSGQI